MHRDVAVSVLLVMATLSAYGPVVGYDFVNFDDGEYVYDNPHIRDGLKWQNVAWAVAAQEEAISLAASAGPEVRVRALERRLLGYRAGRPHRQAENDAHP